MLNNFKQAPHCFFYNIKRQILRLKTSVANIMPKKQQQRITFLNILHKHLLYNDL